MADLRALESPASEPPPPDQDEREAEGRLSQELRDRIERGRAAAIQRKIAQRVYGPVAPNFSAAKHYHGVRENRVCKSGPEGRGYYVDVGPVQQVALRELLFPLEAAPPVPLEMSKLVGDGPRPKHQRPVTVPTPCRRRNRPRKQGVVGVEASLHEADPIWPDDGSLSKHDGRHRCNGMFAVDTTNANAWPGASA